MNKPMRGGAQAPMLSLLLAALLLAAVQLAVVQPAGAQLRASAVYTNSDAASETGFPRVRVLVAPADPRTPPQAADLILVEDGRDQGHAVEVRSFESTGYPMAAAVLIDVSGSMSGKPMEIVRRSLTQFVNDARPKDKVAVMTIADDARWDAPFGADRDTVRSQIAAIAPRGHLTRLYDGLLQAMGDFSPSLPQRRELTIISDGHDEGSRGTLEQVLEMAKSRGISLDAIGLTRSDPKYLKILENMAEQTGGSYREAQSDEQLEALIGNAITNLKATPVASFDCERITPDGKRHQLAVRWKKGNLLSNTISFNAPSKAARPAEYVAKHLPVWVLPVAGVVLLLVLVGIVLAVRGQQKKKRQAVLQMPQQPQPFIPQTPEPEATSFHIPTVDLQQAHTPTLGMNQTPVAPPSYSEPTPLPDQPQPPVPSQPPVQAIPPVGPRMTVMGGSFRAVGGLLGKLQAESGLMAGRSFDISRDAVLQGRFWIGADPGCLVNLGDDATVSGRHAYLVFEDPILILADNNSTNGTWINGQMLKGESRPIKAGDRILIGRTQFRIVA